MPHITILCNIVSLLGMSYTCISPKSRAIVYRTILCIYSHTFNFNVLTILKISDADDITDSCLLIISESQKCPRTYNNFLD